MSGEDRGWRLIHPSFGAYDVLGYFIPGVVLLACVTSLESLAANTTCTGGCYPKTPVLSTLRPLLTLSPDASWSSHALALAVLLLLAYIAGHITASVSAAFIDRVYVARGHGYPLQHHIGTDRPTTDEQASRHFYAAMMFWVNLYLVARFLALPGVLPINDLMPRILSGILPDFTYRDPMRFTARTLSVFIIIASIARGVAKLDAIGRPQWIVTFRESEIGPRILEFCRNTLYHLALPSRIVTGIVGGMSRTSRSIEPATQAAFKARLQTLTGASELASSSSAYWYSFIALRRTDPVSTPLLDNWLRLYSFARNLATAFYLSAVYGIVWWHSQSSTLAFAPDSAVAAIQTIPMVSFVVAFLLLQRYYYLYSDYYTKYLIRAFALDYGTRPSQGP